MKCKKCGAELPEGAVFCCWCGRKQIRSSSAGKKRRPNGTGTVYREGKTWTAEITKGYAIKDGRKVRVKARKRGFALEREALDWCHNRADQTRRALTLEQLWEVWSTSAMLKLSDGKQTCYRIAHDRLLKTDIAFAVPADLRLSDLQTAMDSQCSTYYTARDFKNLLSKLYQRAMADKDCTVNLARMLTLPELDERETVPFNDVEQAAIWKLYTDGDMIAGCILLMIYTGMMPGELMACRKDMIQWDRWCIEGTGLKTQTRRESPIVFPDIIEPVLRQLCDSTRGPRLVSLGRDSFYPAFYSAIERAGIDNPTDADGRHRITPYSCRHTTGTALGRENLSPNIVQKIMRHAKYTSTQRYIHQDTNDLRAAVNVMQRPAASEN